MLELYSTELVCKEFYSNEVLSRTIQNRLDDNLQRNLFKPNHPTTSTLIVQPKLPIITIDWGYPCRLLRLPTLYIPLQDHPSSRLTFSPYKVRLATENLLQAQHWFLVHSCKSEHCSNTLHVDQQLDISVETKDGVSGRSQENPWQMESHLQRPTTGKDQFRGFCKFDANSCNSCTPTKLFPVKTKGLGKLFELLEHFTFASVIFLMSFAPQFKSWFVRLTSFILHNISTKVTPDVLQESRLMWHCDVNFLWLVTNLRLKSLNLNLPKIGLSAKPKLENRASWLYWICVNERLVNEQSTRLFSL